MGPVMMEMIKFNSKEDRLDELSDQGTALFLRACSIRRSDDSWRLQSRSN
jgi:hypothetical protein